MGNGIDMKRTIVCLAVLLCLPLCAQAAYKCKQADGTTSFQDAPCAADAVGSKTALQPVQSVSNTSYGNATPQTSQKQQSATQNKAAVNTQTARYQKEMQAQIDEMKARNKAQQCNYERVAKAQRPVYTTDNNGDRHYIDDDKRAALVADHEQRVANACN